MHIVTVRLTIKREHQQDFMKLMLQNASETLRDESGCERFDVCSNSERPSDIFLYEIYGDSTAFDLHLDSAHFLRFDAQTRHMIENKEVTVYNQLDNQGPI